MHGIGPSTGGPPGPPVYNKEVSSSNRYSAEKITEAANKGVAVLKGMKDALAGANQRESPPAPANGDPATIEMTPLSKPKQTNIPIEHNVYKARTKNKIASGVLNHLLGKVREQTSDDIAIQAITGTFGFILLFSGIFSFHVAGGVFSEFLTLFEIVVGSIFLISSVTPLPIHPATKTFLVFIILVYFILSCVTLHDATSGGANDKTKGAEILVSILGICISLYISIFIASSFVPEYREFIRIAGVVIPFVLGIILAFAYKIL